MSFRNGLIAGLCVAAGFPLGSGAAADGAAPRGGRNEALLCGPLCATYLLRSFGRPEDVDIVSNETEFRGGKGGATMESLVDVLRRRGLSVEPVRVPVGAAFRTTVPAIVHFRRGDSAGGHYVVLLPSAGGETAELWDPAGGRTSIPAGEFAEAHSGAVALVSASPMPRDAIGPVRTGTVLARAWWAAPATAGVCLGLIVWRWRARGSRPCGVASGCMKGAGE